MGFLDRFQPLLNRFGRKDSGATRAIVISNNNRVVHTPRDYASLSKEGYMWNTTVFSCINLRADSVAGIKLKLWSKRGAEIKKHPILDLLDNPNPHQNYADFLATEVCYNSINGNSFINGVGVPTKPEDSKSPLKMPKELYLLRPDRIQILPGTGGELVGGYRYRVGAQIVDYDVSRICHRKTFHPLDDFWGMSALEAAAMPVDSDNNSQKWNMFLLQNSARPSGIIFVKGNLTDEQYKRLQEQIQTNYSGPQNAGRPLLFESKDGGDFKEMSMTPKEMDWLKGRILTKREICQAFKVPSQLIGDPDSQTYANYAEARRAFYQEFVIPYIKKYQDSLNKYLVPFFSTSGSQDGSIYLAYDKSDIEALQEDDDDKAERWGKLVIGGIASPNEARLAIGLDPAIDEYANDRLVPSTSVPVSEAIKRSAQNEANAQQQNDPKISEEQGGGKSPVKRKCYGLNTKEQRVEYWKSVQANRDSWERRCFGITKRTLSAIVSGASKEVDKADTVAHAKIAVNAYVDEQYPQIKGMLHEIYKRVIPDFAGKVQDELTSKSTGRSLSVKFDFQSEVSSYLAEVGATKIKSISDTVKDKISVIIENAQSELDDYGNPLYSMSDIAGMIGDMNYEGQGMVIARTEVMSASNEGAMIGAESTGLDLNKMWIATEDERTRPDHSDADGQEVAFDESFSVGGEDMDQPGDSDDPAEVCNCRCTVAFNVIGS